LSSCSPFLVAGTIKGGSALVLVALAGTGTPVLNLGSDVIVEYDEQLPELADQFAASNPVGGDQIIVARMRFLSDSLNKSEGTVSPSLVEAKVKQRPWLIGINECRAKRVSFSELRHQDLK
jgi:hypothetical protein